MAPLMTSEPTCRPHSDTDLTCSVCRCTFRSQNMFTALQHLTQLRGASYRRKEEPLVHHNWDIRPPDFAVRNYAPPTKKPPRAVSQPIKDDDDDIANRKKDEAEFKSRQRRNPPGANFDLVKHSKDFIISFRIQTPNTARRTAIRNGKHPKGPYLDPKPHDHRGLPPIKNFGLPEIVTSLQPDPFNIRFKTEHLDTHRLPPKAIEPSLLRRKEEKSDERSDEKSSISRSWHFSVEYFGQFHMKQKSAYSIFIDLLAKLNETSSLSISTVDVSDNFSSSKYWEDFKTFDQSQPKRHHRIKTHLATRKTPDPQWVPSLILHKELYRKRYAAFTRHRRLDRSVYSALMERIDEEFLKRLNKQKKGE